MDQPPYDIRERTFEFACRVVAFCEDVADRGYIMRRLAGQLVDAAGSIGANLEEAHAAQSKPDFISKNSIALKESRETRFWLRLISAQSEASRAPAAPLLAEVSQLVKILTAIVVTAKSHPGRGER